MNPGWWIVAGTGAVALVLLVAAVTCRRPGAGARTARPAVAAAGVQTGLASLVFALVVDDEALHAADAPVLAWVVGHRAAGVTAAAEWISLVGGTVWTGGLAVLTAVALWWRGRRIRAGIWVGAIVVGSLTIRGVKGVVERPRPPIGVRLAVETSSSLPSGHSLMAALGLGLTAVGVLSLLGAGGGRGRAAARAATVLFAAVAILAVGASRVYLGVHWSTDVLAGWLLGGALATLAVGLARVHEARVVGSRRPSEGVSPSRLR